MVDPMTAPGRKIRPERRARIARLRLLVGDTGVPAPDLLCGESPTCLHRPDLVAAYPVPCSSCGLFAKGAPQGPLRSAT